jgi:hypothetical protein
VFKVGDKVKVIKYDSKWDALGENRNWIIGEVGEVSHVYEGSDCPYSIEFDNYDDLKEKHSNIPECFMEDELELAQQSKFKVGDRV